VVEAIDRRNLRLNSRNQVRVDRNGNPILLGLSNNPISSSKTPTAVKKVEPQGQARRGAGKLRCARNERGKTKVANAPRNKANRSAEPMPDGKADGANLNNLNLPHYGESASCTPTKTRQSV
jgi:hypothetical protein